MNVNKVTLFLICGKIASGKSTLAKSLAEENNAVLLVQDEWLSKLYPTEIKNIEDYAKYFRRLTKVIGSHVVDILKKDSSVVLDFPANTVEVRAWMRTIIDSAECKHELHVLDTPESICLERLKLRNQQGEHAYRVSEEEFQQFSSHVVLPSTEEGFNLMMNEATPLD